MSYSQYRHSEDPVSAQNSVLFFHGPSLTKAEFLLPAGAKERGYLIEVMIIIRDAYGEASEIKLPIQVLFFVLFLLKSFPLESTFRLLQDYLHYLRYIIIAASACANFIQVHSKSYCPNGDLRKSKCC